MRRRNFLAGAIGGTALLTAGVGSAAGAGGWWGRDPGGVGGGSDPEVVSTTFERRQPDSSERPGAQVDCNGTSVQITGVAQVRDACTGLALASATYDGDTLTVTVASAGSGAGRPCAEVITPRAYAATIVTSSQPAQVVVEHDTVSGGTFTRECGSGGGGGSDGGTGGGGDGVTTDFEVVESGSSDAPGATIECQGTTVDIEGTIEVPDTCHTATLGEVTFDGGELTVHVEATETSGGTPGGCLLVVTPTSYEATVETPSAPERVTVEHGGVTEDTFEHTCGGAASDGWNPGSSAGDGSTDGGSDGNSTDGGSGGSDESDGSATGGWW